MIEHALIFSAGRGERLNPYTKYCPKPLLDVQGLPVLFWHIEKLKTLNIKTIFINHAYLGGEIKAKVRHAFPSLDIQFLSEPPGGLETGGTLAFFKQQLTNNSSDLLCINADIYCNYHFDLNTLLGDNIKAKLILIPTANSGLGGNFSLGEQGFVLSKNHPTLTFSGIAYYSKNALLELPIGRYSIRDLLFKWSSQRQIVGEVHHGFWLDIGTVETWLKAR
jgi:N-acetyl-alpha-D-muramate 1-phosphate uridylyltransferase